MLGVYDYTVVLTYVSVLISMGGMLFSLNGCPKMAVVCLAVSGFCDMFDGKIARTKKNRTEVEKRFGIQIDSLADIICFGVAPSLIAYRMGMNHIVGIAILMFYVLAGLIRLAWFNVSEEIRQNETEENRDVIRACRSLLWQLHSRFWLYSVRCWSENLLLRCMHWYWLLDFYLLRISDSVSRKSWDRLSWLSLWHWQCFVDYMSGK